jgi:hypothetical protein
MSRSRKKTPKLALSSSVSEKDDKRRYHRGRRHAAKAALKCDSSEPPPETEHRRSGTWNFAKDGKHWRKSPEPKHMRK